MSKALPELTVLFKDFLCFLLLGVELREKFLLALQNVAYLHLRYSEHLYETLFGPFSVLQSRPLEKYEEGKNDNLSITYQSVYLR